MRSYLVTVIVQGLPQQPRGTKKKSGQCPANPNKRCTDIEGQHHTILIETYSAVSALEKARREYGHVTRVEEA